MKIYHNPRCAKSRQTLALMHDHNVAPEIVLYLVDVPDAHEMKDLLLKLGMTPLELIRKNEASWKENYKGKNLSDDQVIEAMIAHPKLIERPIVIKDTQAVLGRPPENVLKLL
ncbi:MAG: arsenate reductase (glutaredoxin) [Flavobacteriales bacterium]|nr:arsenate reductase (glutaredoxin) [Flavobacteriales bacterium]|tara:strand:+ start:435 stop:773 length:339 start_codon:yes stop_codon:yes gene_type:complete